MSNTPKELVTDLSALIENALTLADAIRDGTIEAAEAGDIVARGKVFLPFRYGQGLAFAPAKFIGYQDNSLIDSRSRAKQRDGKAARVAISKLLGNDAVEDKSLEKRLQNYCLEIGVSLADNKHSFWKPVNGLDTRDRSAIDDIDPFGSGNTDVDYRRRMAGSYVRDQKVRNAVLARAAGRCEYCHAEGFETSSGGRYLETHHVIELSAQGVDRTTNVIALCATDHRRAHFSSEWKALQRKFSSIIRAKSSA